MNRQQTVIAIARINKAIKILAYWQELEPKRYVSVVEPVFIHIGEWASGIRDFLVTCEDRKVFRLASLIAEPTVLHYYIRNCHYAIPPKELDSIKKYLETLPEFHRLSNAQRKGTKGREAACLPEGIDDAETVSLMRRAVDAGLLDKSFRPLEHTANFQLRLIAFAVGKLRNYGERNKWHYFDKLWPPVGDNRISRVPIPRNTKQDMVEAVTSLYPEVDFTPILDTESERLCFRNDKSGKAVRWLYSSLKDGKYISDDTTLPSFRNIFSMNGDFVPVEWIKDQRHLTYFVHAAFGNMSDCIWKTAEACFLVNGKRPNKHSMMSAMTKMVHSGSYESVDPKLLGIAETFRDMC